MIANREWPPLESRVYQQTQQEHSPERKEKNLSNLLTYPIQDTIRDILFLADKLFVPTSFIRLMRRSHKDGIIKRPIPTYAFGVFCEGFRLASYAWIGYNVHQIYQSLS